MRPVTPSNGMRQSTVIAFALLSACTPLTDVKLPMDANTSELLGWFGGARGEWALFPATSLDRDYYPYTENEDEKCVTLVNATGLPREDYYGLDGELVTAMGRPLSYDSLVIGQSDVDVLLRRRYFDDVPVFNFCLRDYVFAVTSFHRR